MARPSRLAVLGWSVFVLASMAVVAVWVWLTWQVLVKVGNEIVAADHGAEIVAPAAPARP